MFYTYFFLFSMYFTTSLKSIIKPQYFSTITDFCPFNIS